jgi:hypothetical protein
MGSGGMTPYIPNIQPLYPKERVPDIHWLRSWVDPTSDLDVLAKRKIPEHDMYRIPVIQPTASHY